MHARFRVLLRPAAVAGAVVALTCAAPHARADDGDTIVITPARVTRAVGETQSFTATLHRADGTTRNVTQQVRWHSSDAGVAAAPNATGKRSRIETRAPGTAQISAADPVTGAASGGKGDATLIVVGALERISLAPERVTRKVGEAQNLTATGHYAGGTTRNLTQAVRYESSDPQVATAPNTDGKRSRIDVIAPGTATISATDPKTGISSTASGGDASITAVGPLDRLSIAPETAIKGVGDAQSFTVTGHYAGGTTRNLTQLVRYESSDSRVATASNADGKRSRVEAVAVGTATISARDPESGLTTGAATLTVVPAGTAPTPSPDGAADAPPAQEER
jgi:trimeric autotransporter adhesin